MYIYIYKGKVIFIKYLKIHPSLRISSPFFFSLFLNKTERNEGREKDEKGRKEGMIDLVEKFVTTRVRSYRRLEAEERAKKYI